MYLMIITKVVDTMMIEWVHQHEELMLGVGGEYEI